MGLKRPNPADHSIEPKKAKKADASNKPDHDDGEPSTQPKAIPQKPQNSHVRFSSNSPPPQPSTKLNDRPPTDSAQEHEDHDEQLPDEDSEDDAPESVTVSDAAAQARASAAEQARVRRKEQGKERDKRREQDARLKAQTQGKEKKRGKKKERVKAPAYTEAEPARQSTELPELLPDEVLADERVLNRPPTPDLEDEKPSKDNTQQPKNQHIRFDVQEKKVKDVRKGAVTVSVLKKQSKVLPPKANKNSLNMRSQWLEKSRQQHLQARLGSRVK